jgi:hypothetical protein
MQGQGPAPRSSAPSLIYSVVGRAPLSSSFQTNIRRIRGQRPRGFPQSATSSADTALTPCLLANPWTLTVRTTLYIVCSSRHIVSNRRPDPTHPIRHKLACRIFRRISLFDTFQLPHRIDFRLAHHLILAGRLFPNLPTRFFKSSLSGQEGSCGKRVRRRAPKVFARR